MSRLSRIEKKIAKCKVRLDTLNMEKHRLLKAEEEENQKPPREGRKNPGKGGRQKKGEHAPGEDGQKGSRAEKIKMVRYSYMRQAPLFHARRKSLKELLAPDALDPNNYGYLKLQDAGRDVYVRNYYIDRMPRDATFASTFAELYNFTNVMSQTRIEPVDSARAIHMFDRQVLDLDTELMAANKSGDRNRYRKISQKMQDTEGWAKDLESGRNKIFNVTFLFQTYARTLEDLNAIGNDFHTRALGKNMSVVSCYGVEPEAYRSGFPMNRLYKSRLGPVTTMTARKQQMDLYSLATIFNHTRSSFYHKNGVYLGRDMATHRPITFDPYDASLEAHNIIFAGKTGTGKSATIKMFLSRAADFGLKFCVVDSEARGRQGEYSILTKKLGGQNFQVHARSEEIVNLFEVSEEMEYDESTGQEVPALHLVEKISIIKGILMTMITYGKSQPAFEDATAIESIIDDIVAYLYESRTIKDGDPESLYVSTAGYSSVKKQLPTITDFYIEVLKRQQINVNTHHKKGYAMILDSMKSYVRELYYVPGDVKILDREEYEKLPMDKEGRRYSEARDRRINVISIHGVRSYYDGQSTIQVDLDTPAVNIDISQLPSNDLPIGMVIATNFLNENIVKKNSANPRRLQKRAVLVDEAHRMFPYPELRRFLSDLYRSARKRFVAPICCTQSLADFNLYDETKEIVKQSPMIFMLRQDAQDREYIAQAARLSPGQLDRLFSLGGRARDDGSVAEKGQVCMVINERVAFVQIDYLEYSELDVVETNMQKIHEHNRRRRKNGNAEEKNKQGV